MGERHHRYVRYDGDSKQNDGGITCQLDAFQLDAVKFQRANRTRASWRVPMRRVPGRRGFLVKEDKFTWW